MQKWTARVLLVLMAAVVLFCLPPTVIFSLIRHRIGGVPFSVSWRVLVEDVREIVGFFVANWRDTDNGENSGT